MRPEDVTGPSTLPDIPVDLIDAIRGGECVLYAGAGLGARVGLPTWFELARQLTDWAIEGGFFEPSYAASLREALAVDSGLVADSVVSRIEEALGGRPGALRLARYLQTIFVPSSLPLPLSHRFLRRLPFSAVLTTNFDDLLDRAFAEPEPPSYTPADAETLLSALSKDEFFLLKLYGSLDRPESVIIAPGQYERAVADNGHFGRFMANLFLSKTLFFIGASLDGIDDYLKGLPISSQQTRKHYALVDVSGSAWRVKASVLERRYGIHVLPYQASRPDWPETDEFLRRMIASVESVETPASVHARGLKADMSLLRRLEIENIGPFDSLSMDFDPGWNVLLGDNGVGKSSILKAIAVGLSGSEAQKYAGRLIKVGRSKATIVLETGRGKYVTELFRTDVDPEIRSPAGSPLVSERWLALGFPPLRGFTWNRSTGGTSRLDRPSAADLQPLLAGELDPRLDGLKNWLVASAQPGPPDPSRPSPAQRKKLFEIIGALTPRLLLQYGHADDNTGEVTVVTEDGDLPIESVSQGTASLLGWVGVLLRRQFDVHSAEPEDPWTRPALVLIDEVDAHMHPAWQQHLPVAIGKQFENLQIVATTHSPLVVSSLAPSQILMLYRDGGTIVNERPALDPRGRDADQVLTSRMFYLDATTDPVTQEQLAKYARLKILDTPSSDQRAQLRELAASLERRLPPAYRDEQVQKEYEARRDDLVARIRAQSPEERTRFVEETRRTLGRTEA